MLKGEAYRAIGIDNLSVWSKRVMPRVKLLMRFEGELILPSDRAAPKDAAALLLNAMSVAPEHEHEFNEWYNTEHIPALAAVPGTLCARRFRGTGSAPQRFVALYHLASSDVPGSVAWKKGRQHALDRTYAAAFPRPPAHRQPPLYPRIGQLRSPGQERLESV